MNHKNLYSCILLVFFCFFTQACSNLKKTNLVKPTFELEGHRGCRGLMPENTIPAMIRAIDIGVNTLEMDAVISKDRQVVVSHEPFFNHEISTKPDGRPVEESEERSLNIYSMNYDEVKTFDVGLKPHPRFPEQKKLKVSKPLLADLIDSVETYCKAHNKKLPAYNIEIKSLPLTDNIFHPAPKEFVDLVINVIQTKAISQRTIIQSFDFRALQYVHQQYPSYKTALLIEGDDKRNFEDQLAQLGFTPDIYSPESSLVSEELVKKCHNRKIKIIPWTVDDPKEMKSLVDMHVDGLITDYPDRF
jgi:glycerophosphoryl diester phosphodiesterase